MLSTLVITSIAFIGFIIGFVFGYNRAYKEAFEYCNKKTSSIRKGSPSWK